MAGMSELPPESAPLQAADPNADEAVLLEYLKTHDALCPLCKYNLRNLTVPRCPECGRGLRLTVGMTEPYLLPWVLLTVFMAMAASVGVLFLAICILEGPPDFGSLNSREIAPCSGACWGLLAIPLTLMLVAGRRTVLRWERSAQWTLAVITFVINFFLLVATMASVH